MRNIFLSTPKDLYDLDLSLLAITIIAQVLEWDRNGKLCYETDAVLAKRFKSSPSTVNRTIASLAKEGYLFKKTENTKDGRMRTLSPNHSFIELQLSNLQLATEQNETQSSNLQLDAEPMGNLPNGNQEKDNQLQFCLLRNEQNDLMRNKQDDLIKDKREKEKLKDKVRDLLNHSIVVSPSDAEWIELTKEEWCNIGFAALAHYVGTVEDIQVYQANGKIYLVRFPV